MSSNSDSTPSAPLSATDAQALYTYGLTITEDAVGMIWETMFMSAYGIFFALALYSIFRKGLKSRSSIIMLCVVVYLYATSLTLWALNVTSWFKNCHILFMGDPNIPLPDRRDIADDNLEVFGPPEEALFMFNMVVGDTVVIWRAWVLYRKTLWAVALPCLMLLMSFIFNVIDLTCLTGTGWSNQSAIAGGGAICAHAELISWAFSFGTNATCTILIGYKAWEHRRAMKALNIVNNPRRLSTDKVLSLLVESGFIYCLFWLTQYILFVDIDRTKPIIWAYELFSSMGDQISGLYPTIIIVIVNFHQTIWESTSTVELGTTNPTISTVRWAPSSKRSATDTVIFGQRDNSIQLDNVARKEIGMDNRSFDRHASENV
ncbi:hypothetical protein MSAN_00592100 [Mycena sanguinolenta]|uniref:Uncharacterized protein n=1 Tax=Mycena sanguinolenta TaxID=230812 RepID=A0A8H6ZAR8_9AGAR|nr:hypothetical protein MSAN_00592100 [Mycena sanguinolenta]